MLHKLSKLDERLIRLLSDNARESVAALSRKLGVTRSTVQTHVAQLEHRGVIQAYTLRLAGDIERTMLEAHVSIVIDHTVNVSTICRQLKKIEDLRALYMISGESDLITTLKSHSSEQIGRTVSKIVALNGVSRTQTSIILSVQFER